MLRILAFLLVVLVLGLGFGWLADNPGQVTFVWQGNEVQTSLMVFLIALGLLIVAVVAALWLVRAFFKTPHALGSWWSRRRRDRGYKALSTGILAAGAGDSILARRMTGRAQKLLDHRREPLVRFLDAQTAMIEGDHARARAAFEQMEADPETRLLALRGLYLEAERLGDDGAARNYAERAVRIAPHVPWAGGAVLDSKSLEGDWDGALEILEAQKNTRLIERAESKRLRAVLLTAKAMTLLERDPSTAKTAGVEAHNLAPDLVPAALVAARALFRLGNLKKGAKILEASWTSGPHPEVADAFVHARAGDSVEDRMRRARRLYELRPGHVESELAMAHAALDARDLPLARRHTLAAIEAEPRESAFLLMADIEEEETGEIGRVRQWLARAIRAPRDPAWTADGIISKTWAPISPVSGRLDAFQWKVPVERVGGEEGPLVEDMKDLGPAPVEAKPAEPSADHAPSLPLKDGAPGGATAGASPVSKPVSPVSESGMAGAEGGSTTPAAAYGRSEDASGKAA